MNDLIHPAISVIIVNWNGLKWLGRCLDSLKDQSYPNLEVIVIDNGSEDDSVSFISENHPEVRVFATEQNNGFASGVNIGISKSIGSYILLLNTDTYLDPESIETMFNELVARRLDVIGPMELPYDSSIRNQRVTSSMNIDLLGYPVFNSSYTFYLSGVCLLFTKKLYKDTGGLDDNFFMYVEEVDWFWRLQLMRKTFAYSNLAYVYHAGGASSGGYGLNKNIFLWRNTNTLQMLLKNYKYSTLILILPIYMITNIFELVFVSILKPSFITSYTKAYADVFKYRKEIINKHKEIRAIASIGDNEIIKHMYIGSGKLRHLISKYR